MSTITAPPSSYPISPAGQEELRRLGYLRLPDICDELPEVGPDLEIMGGRYRTAGLLLGAAGTGSIDRKDVSSLLGLLRGARAEQERLVADDRERGIGTDAPESEADLAAIEQLLVDLGNTRTRDAITPLPLSDGQREVVVEMLDNKVISLREESELSLQGLVSRASWLKHLLDVANGDAQPTMEDERDLIGLLREHRKEVLDSADYEADKLPLIEAGEFDYFFVGFTQQESIEKCKGYIKEHRRTVALCDSALALLTDTPVAVAA